MSDVTSAQFTELLEMLKRLDWAGATNPNRRYANQVQTADIPPSGSLPDELPQWFNVEDVGCGGTLVIRSPHLWCTHIITEQRSAVRAFPQRWQVRTGPASEAHIFVNSQASITTVVHRRTDQAADPTVDPITGLISGAAGTANPGTTEQVYAYFVQGVQPHELPRVPMSYLFSSAEPRDAVQPAAAVETALSYAPFVDRYALLDTATLGGNIWNVRGPDAFPAGPLFETSGGVRATLSPGVWNYISATPTTLRNISLQWSIAALLP